MSYIDDLNQAATEALAASSSATDSAQIMFDVANGGETTTVTTANGEVKTLAKAIKDIIDSIEAGVEAPQVEPQTLSAGQTTVSLTTMTTEGIAVYVEGSREFDFTVVNSTDFDFGQSFPDGTRVWIVKRDIEGTADSFTVNTSTGTQTLSDSLDNRVIYVNTIADLQALPTSELVDGQAAVVVKGGDYTWDANTSSFVPRFSGTSEFRVPEDFPSLQKAFDELSNVKVPSSSLVNVIISSGYVIEEGLSLRRGDYSAFRISSDDAVVNVGGAFTEGPVMRFDHCRAPEIDVLIDQNGLGLEGGSSYSGAGALFLHSFGRFRPGAGIINAKARGLEVSTSVVDAFGTIWDGAGGRGVRVSNSSSCKAREASAKNCGEEGLAVSQSTVSADDGDFSGSAVDNIFISSGSSASLTGVKATDAGGSALVVFAGCTVNSAGIDAKNAAVNGILVTGASMVSASLADVSGAGGQGVYARTGAVISARAATISTSSNKTLTGLRADQSAYIFADSAFIHNWTNLVAQADSGATISIRSADLFKEHAFSDFVISTRGVIDVSDVDVSTLNMPTNIPINMIRERGGIFCDQVARTKGSSTWLSGTASITVNHGLQVTPFFAGQTHIYITLRGDSTSAGVWWLESVNSTSFTLQSSSTPSSDIDFDWIATTRDMS